MASLVAGGRPGGVDDRGKVADLTTRRGEVAASIGERPLDDRKVVTGPNTGDPVAAAFGGMARLRVMEKLPNRVARGQCSDSAYASDRRRHIASRYGSRHGPTVGFLGAFPEAMR